MGGARSPQSLGEQCNVQAQDLTVGLKELMRWALWIFLMKRHDGSVGGSARLLWVGVWTGRGALRNHCLTRSAQGLFPQPTSIPWASDQSLWARVCRRNFLLSIPETSPPPTFFSSNLVECKFFSSLRLFLFNSGVGGGNLQQFFSLELLLCKHLNLWTCFPWF